MPETLEGLVWLLLLLGPLLILQRVLHRETQAIFLMLTRRADIALALFSLLFFPGVLLHESSHYIMARLLGVRTGRFSLLPRPMPGGRLQLGFVETAGADWARDSLIGVAPLLAGGAFVAYAGIYQLGLTALWESLLAGGPAAALNILTALYARPDFWLWFYLTFAISSTMLPSPSDRRAWMPITLIVAVLLGVSLLAGAGPWLLQNLASPMNEVLQTVAIVFAISVFIHVVLVPPLWGVRSLLGRMLGLRVV